MRPDRWRAPLSAFLISVAAILVPVSVVAGWARVQLVDQNAFVDDLAPLAGDPDVQALIVERTTDAIDEAVDFARLSDGPLGPALGGATASALRALTADAVSRAVQSDAFAELWRAALVGAHKALTTAATSDGGGFLVLDQSGLGLRIGAVVALAKEGLVDRGIALAAFIPDVDRVVLVGDGTLVRDIRAGYALTTAVGWWLPVVAAALLAMGVVVARRRTTAVFGVGIGICLGAGLLAAALWAGIAAAGAFGERSGLEPAGVEAVYRALIGPLAVTALVVAAAGLALSVVVRLASRFAVSGRGRLPIP